MDRAPESKGPFSAGLLCAGALLLARHALLAGDGDGGELAAWLLAGTLPERLIESLILGVVTSALAYRVPGLTAFLFNALVLSWAVAGLPRPDAGAAWPLALVLGLALSGAVLLMARWRPGFLDTTWGAVSSALLGVGVPALLLGGASAPTWEVEGLRVSPTLARPDAPALVLVILDGVGARRADPGSMPALATIARAGSRFTCAVAAAPTRPAALGSLLGPQGSGGRSLAEDLARQGFSTALFGPPGLPVTEGYRVTDLTAASPDGAVERAASWLRGVAGARFLLTVVIPADAAGAEDLRDSDGDVATAGLRSADRALGSLLAHLSSLSIDQETIVAVVGTVEGQGPPSMKQSHLQVPLFVVGPGLPVGRTESATVEARAIGPSLGYWGGGESGLDLLARPAGLARFAGGAGERGIRQGGWTLWFTGEGQAQLFQVESDPEERSDMAAELPGRVESLSALLEL